MHQGSALSSLLFVIVMEAVSREFRVALSLELLHADDMVVIAETESEVISISIIYFTSGAVAVDSSHMTTSSSASWSRFSPPSNFVNGHVSTVWFMVCRWPQSQEGDWVRPHWRIRGFFINDMRYINPRFTYLLTYIGAS